MRKQAQIWGIFNCPKIVEFEVLFPFYCRKIIIHGNAITNSRAG